MFKRGFLIAMAVAGVALFALGGEALAQQGPPLDGGASGGGAGGAGGGGAQGGGPPPQGPFGGTFMLMLLGLFAFMIIMSMMAGRKEKKQMREMLASLTRHDRIMTNGGIIGVITEVRDDEIVLKVDEATNTRIRFAKSAVKTVLKHASDRGGASDEIIDEPAEHEDAHRMESATVS
jgi:preprotein translocase subunit YajC